MSKYVYLFELDSVRKTDDEILYGQKVLYNEIVNNGNIVVLTYNQLVDSRAFFSLLRNENYQQNFVRLFENGAIKISQFRNTRSLAQYLIDIISQDKEFFYSALPVKYSQKRILALMKRSLIYSDLTEIDGYLKGMRSDDELIELFQEVDKQKQIHDSFLFESHKPTKDILQEMRGILQNLYSLMATILKLSALCDIYIQPRDPKEYEELKMHNMIRYVSKLRYENDPYWESAIRIIKKLKHYHENGNERSIYLHELKDIARESSSENKVVYQYAEAILNLCYNYACELSICNVSKHYNVNELSMSSTDARPTFRIDFKNRLQQDWRNRADAKKRYLLDETSEFCEYQWNKKLPDFSKAVRYTEYVSYKENAEKVHRYEYEFRNDQKRHRGNLRKSMYKKGGLALFALIIAWGVEQVFSSIQTLLNFYASRIPFIITGVIITLIFLFITEKITTWISDKVSWFLPLSESIQAVVVLGEDIISTWISAREKDTSNYLNSCKESIAFTEDKSHTIPIGNLVSPAMKRYLELKKKSDNKHLFTPSKIYPIADIESTAQKKELIKMEELYSYQFGIVYRSKYNTLVVDPIENKTEIYPYERIIPSSGKDGVVMLTKCHDKFLLLRQYRHALRDEQYSFPRGFAESDLTPYANALKELTEEIRAEVTKEPILLGRVSPDSGLTSTKAYVYYVEVDAYTYNQTIHEGIEEIVEISVSEMDDWIKNGKINDGFTLSAYALFRSEYRRK